MDTNQTDTPSPLEMDEVFWAAADQYEAERDVEREETVASDMGEQVVEAAVDPQNSTTSLAPKNSRREAKSVDAKKAPVVATPQVEHGQSSSSSSCSFVIGTSGERIYPSILMRSSGSPIASRNVEGQVSRDDLSEETESSSEEMEQQENPINPRRPKSGCTIKREKRSSSESAVKGDNSSSNDQSDESLDSLEEESSADSSDDECVKETQETTVARKDCLTPPPTSDDDDFDEESWHSNMSWNNMNELRQPSVVSSDRLTPPPSEDDDYNEWDWENTDIQQQPIPVNEPSIVVPSEESGDCRAINPRPGCVFDLQERQSNNTPEHDDQSNVEAAYERAFENSSTRGSELDPNERVATPTVNRYLHDFLQTPVLNPPVGPHLVPYVPSECSNTPETTPASSFNSRQHSENSNFESENTSGSSPTDDVSSNLYCSDDTASDSLQSVGHTENDNVTNAKLQKTAPPPPPMVIPEQSSRPPSPTDSWVSLESSDPSYPCSTSLYNQLIRSINYSSTCESGSTPCSVSPVVARPPLFETPTSSPIASSPVSSPVSSAPDSSPCATPPPPILRKELKMDGLMITGDTWNICKLDGRVAFFPNMRVKTQPSLQYKGLKHAVEATYRYEIAFANVDNLSLSLLCTSNVNTKSYKSRKTGVNYDNMVRRFQNIVLQAMKELDCASHYDQMLGANKYICVLQGDWEEVGNLVTEKLLSNWAPNDDSGEEEESEKMRRVRLQVFPNKTQFCFMLKKFGQDQPYNRQLNENPYPHIRKNHINKIILHVAHDYTVNERIMFFTTYLCLKLNITPTHVYNIGLIPNTNNYLLMKIPRNAHHVACIQQYTRLFHQVHRNTNDFFSVPVIAKTVMMTYTSKLAGNMGYKRQPIVYKLTSGVLLNMMEAIKGVLHSQNPIPSRCEFVWSFQKKRSNNLVSTNRSEQDEENAVEADVGRYQRIYPESILPLIHQAFRDCKIYNLMNHCCPVESFKSFGADTIKTYLWELLSTLFNTLNFGVEKLSKFLNVPDTEPLYSEDYHLGLQDFADMHIAEAFLTRILRGQMDKFNNLLLEYIDDDVPEDQDILDWPFKQEFVWKEDGVLRSKIPITYLFRDFTTFLDNTNQTVGIVELHDAYRKWKQVSKSAKHEILKVCSEKLFERLCHVILQQILMVNKKEATNIQAVETIMQVATFAVNREYKIYDSVSLYKQLTQMNVRMYKELAAIVHFLELIKTQLFQRYDGGTQYSIALQMDRVMMEAGKPLVLLLPKVLIPIFVPLTFSEPNETVARIYSRAFRLKYKRVVGRRRINVFVFQTVLMKEMSKLPLNERPRNLDPIFRFINTLLDSGSEKVPPIFEERHQPIKEALLAVVGDVFTNPAPRRRQQHLDLDAVSNLPGIQTRQQRRKRHDALVQQQRDEAESFIGSLLNFSEPSVVDNDDLSGDEQQQGPSKRRRLTESGGSTSRAGYSSGLDDTPRPKLPPAKISSTLHSETQGSDPPHARQPVSLSPIPATFGDAFAQMANLEHSSVGGSENQHLTLLESSSEEEISYHHARRPASALQSSVAIPSRLGDLVLGIAASPSPHRDLRNLSGATSEESTPGSENVPTRIPTSHSEPCPANFGDLFLNVALPSGQESESEHHPSPLVSSSSNGSENVGKGQTAGATDQGSENNHSGPSDADNGSENLSPRPPSSDVSSYVFAPPPSTVVSRGLLFKSNRGASTGTSYDEVTFSGENVPARPLVLERKQAPRQRKETYQDWETKKIFEYLDKEDCLMYMQGRNICHAMSNRHLKVVDRTGYAIYGHIQRMLDSEDLPDIVGEELYQRIHAAKVIIDKQKHSHHISKDDIAQRFGVILGPDEK